MKKLLYLFVIISLSLNLQAQQRDTIQNDSLKKKKVQIEDYWSKDPKAKKKQVSSWTPKNKSEVKYNSYADTTDVKVFEKKVVTVVDSHKGTEVNVGNKEKYKVVATDDTTRIRIGRRRIDIVDGWNGTRVKFDRVDSWDRDDYHAERERGFRGHWAGFDLGVNGFADENYSAYGGNEFMELDMLKSTGVNINFLQYDISLQKDRNTIGLVTGMGFEWNNYRFDRNITLKESEAGIIQEEPLNPDWSIKKSKLTTWYLTVPLLLEFQIPVGYYSRRVHFSAGVVGGLRLGSHTKIKYKKNGNTHKDKDHDDFNLKALRYAAHVRLGYRSINLFATYGLTELFENNKGPKLTPYTVGLTLVNF